MNYRQMNKYTTYYKYITLMECYVRSSQYALDPSRNEARDPHSEKNCAQHWDFCRLG